MDMTGNHFIMFPMFPSTSYCVFSLSKCIRCCVIQEHVSVMVYIYTANRDVRALKPCDMKQNIKNKTLIISLY
ncbi:hypothetical protein GDO81_011769 [Engystomops pustulosus]|uniref:Uncharacterized protein n=1 Tax=Engystomops pustulosus TaxID=76066 RepID=A0AAV7BGU5_ENGPU|nr:hypothetical protein GDO81_011769 [Engystomops pustulosus]